MLINTVVVPLNETEASNGMILRNSEGLFTTAPVPTADSAEQPTEEPTVEKTETFLENQIKSEPAPQPPQSQGTTEIIIINFALHHMTL